MGTKLACISVGLSALMVSGCGDNDSLSCGAGTVEQGDQCVALGADGGSSAAPTVASIEPAGGLVGGGEPFTITGTGFLSGGQLSVHFGEHAADFEVVSDTEITGTTARASAEVVDVTVANGNGSAAAEFSYTGLWAADGKSVIAGNLYLIDPRDGYSLTIAAIEDDGGDGRAITGLAVAADGTLWATEATARGGVGGIPDLMTIDRQTGAVTVIDDLGIDVGTTIPDLTMTADGDLLGWHEGPDEAVIIDTATGAITSLGGGTSSYGDGLATMADGTVLVAPQGVQGDLSSVNLADGAVTSVVELQGASAQPPICAMTVFRGTLYAVQCTLASGQSGSTLIAIDPADGTIDYIAGLPPGLDALASGEVAASSAALAAGSDARAAGALVLTAEHQAVRAEASARARTAAAAFAACTADRAGTIRIGGMAISARDLASHPASIAIPGRRSALRGLPIGGVVSADSALVATTCDGTHHSIPSGAILVRNQRGLIKLVDGSSKRTLLRGITTISSR